jgi:hypothetical protein
MYPGMKKARSWSASPQIRHEGCRGPQRTSLIVRGRREHGYHELLPFAWIRWRRIDCRPACRSGGDQRPPPPRHLWSYFFPRLAELFFAGAFFTFFFETFDLAMIFVFAVTHEWNTRTTSSDWIE